MATTSRTTTTKPDTRNLTREGSLGRKAKPSPSSKPETNADGSDRGKAKEKKPLPNYLKPTISSRPDPVKFLRKNNAHEDNHKILRRRSFDRPLSSLTSPSISSSQKYLNISPPARPRDRTVVPREKSVTGLRSTSFHGSSGGGLRGVKKSGLTGGSGPSKSKKEGSENVPKESSPLAPAHKGEEEIFKVETVGQVSDHREETKEEDEDQVVQPVEEKETSPVDASKEEERRQLIMEDTTEENKSEDNENVENKVDDEENSEIVVTEMKETANFKESKEDQEEEEEEEEEEKEEAEKEEEEEEEEEEEAEKEEEEEEKEEDAEKEEEEEEEETVVNKDESEGNKVEQGTTETKAQEEEASGEEGRKKESPSAYNDVIASKMQENSRKNKVLALAGAFQTVIDYETAASK